MEAPRPCPREWILLRKLNTDRNREILLAFEAGSSPEQLSEVYAISATRVREILYEEKHRRNHSPDPFYRQLRRSYRVQGV
jgi:hypothetical protein